MGWIIYVVQTHGEQGEIMIALCPVALTYCQKKIDNICGHGESWKIHERIHWNCDQEIDGNIWESRKSKLERKGEKLVSRHNLVFQIGFPSNSKINNVDSFQITVMIKSLSQYYLNLYLLSTVVHTTYCICIHTIKHASICLSSFGKFHRVFDFLSFPFSFYQLVGYMSYIIYQGKL